MDMLLQEQICTALPTEHDLQMPCGHTESSSIDACSLCYTVLTLLCVHSLLLKC